MTRAPVISVLTPRTYPPGVKNSDLWQGVALLRLGEFSRISVRVQGLNRPLAPLSILVPLACARVLELLARRVPAIPLERAIEALMGRALVLSRDVRGTTAIIGHGFFPMTLSDVCLPPILWGPGFMPDDFADAAGLSPLRRLVDSETRRRLGPKAAGVFLTSSASVRLWNERVGVPGPDRIFQIPYFMPSLPRSTEIELPASPGGTELNVLFVGAQARRKNLPRLIEACGILARRSRRVVLTVVSDFRDGQVDTKAPFIRSLGRRGNQEVLELLQKSHVLCVPSLVESFGMIYVEALARGCPVVAPDRQMQRSLFEGAAEFCDPEMPESIAAAIERAGNEAKKRELVTRGIDLYRARFAPDIVASAMVEAALAIAA